MDALSEKVSKNGTRREQQTFDDVELAALGIFSSCLIEAVQDDEDNFKHLPKYFPVFASNLHAAMHGNEILRKREGVSGEFYRRELMIIFYASRMINKWLDDNFIAGNKENLKICEWLNELFLTSFHPCDIDGGGMILDRIRSTAKRLNGFIKTGEK